MVLGKRNDFLVRNENVSIQVKLCKIDLSECFEIVIFYSMDRGEQNDI